MTAEEFELHKPKLSKLTQQTNTLAHSILVRGLTPKEAYTELGMTKQNAYRQMKKVNALIEGMPATWVKVDEFMPDWMAVEVRARIKKEREKINI